LSANNNGMMNEMPDDMPMAQAALPTTTFTVASRAVRISAMDRSSGRRLT